MKFVVAVCVVLAVIVAILLLKNGDMRESPSTQEPSVPGESHTTEPADSPTTGAISAAPGATQQDYQAPATSGYLKDLALFVDREYKETRVWPDIDQRLPKVTSEEDIAAVLFVLRDSKDNDTVRHEAINLLRRSGYAPLADEVAALLERSEEHSRFRGFLAQHLYVEASALTVDDPQRSQILRTLKGALDDKDLEVRREAFLGISKLRDPQARTEILAGIAQEERLDMRDLYIREAYKWKVPETLPEIRKTLTHKDDYIAVAAIHTVGLWKDSGSTEALENIASDAQNRRRQLAAQRALKSLSAP